MKTVWPVPLAPFPLQKLHRYYDTVRLPVALGVVVKKPAVIETPQGDAIAIIHMVFLSHSYDHRVVDGSLGGMFVIRVADYLEQFDANRKVFI